MSDQNPWLSIWCRPRATIRQIVAENPNRSLWILAFVYGFLSLLNSFQSISVSHMMGVIPLLAVTLVLSPFWGYLVFAVWSWVVSKVGRWLNGQGDFVSVRAAFAWSCVPLVVNIVLWFLMIVFFGLPFFFDVNEGYPMSHQATAFLFLILISKVVIAIWSLVIYLNALAEVQRFSVLRAIFNVIISWLILGIVLGVVWFGFVSLLQMGADTSKLSFEFWPSATTIEYLRAVL